VSAGLSRDAPAPVLELGLFDGAIARQTIGGVWLGDHANPGRSLACSTLQKHIRGALCGGLFRSLWISLPTPTFSFLRNRSGGPPPLRSVASPLGVEGLSTSDSRRVSTFNKIAAFLGSLMHLARVLRIPCIAIAPAASWIWTFPSVQAAGRLPNVRTTSVDLCGFGAVRRQRVKILSVHCNLDSLPTPTCSGGHRCSFSDRPHSAWRGVLQDRGHLWPPQFCTIMRAILEQARTAAVGRGLWRFFG